MKIARFNGETDVRRAGFTLTEMLVAMVLLGTCMALGVSLIETTFKAGRAAEATSDRVAKRDELARQFRADVARAQTAPDQLGDLAAGPGVLILAMPREVVVIYRIENSSLQRIERVGDKETRRALPAGSKETKVEFIRVKEGSGDIVTLRLTEPRKNGPARILETTSALGGDLR